ncbi:MAG: FAD-dependent oxidoreductase, partial [Deltaproteobacteria bacterium]
MERRIEDHPFTRIERGSEVTIEFAGRAVRGFEGESVAMTLLADGITILSRSPKYQRPRGLFCGAGGCGNCLMRIDGMPNVRACRTPVHDGMKVEIQKSFPVAMPRVIETLFPHGIPYHTLFTHFRTINEAFLRITRRVAAAGRLPERWGEAVKHEEQREVDLLIVGGGGAGLAAAGAAAGVGASVLLVERDEAPGGYLRSASAPVTGSATGEERRKRGIELTRDLIAHAEAQGVEIMTDTTAVAFDPEGRIALVHPGGLTVVIPKRTIFTTGAYDLPLPFVNNDLPGIFTFHALQRIVNLAGILPGERILMIGSNSEVLHFACSLPRFGIRLGGIITESPALEGTMGEEFTESGVPIFVNRRIVRAVGREGVEGVE